MSGPSVGDPAPDAVLLDQAGRESRLSDSWRLRPTVLVFLRYFGCPFCQAQVVALRDDQERFAAAGADIVLIGQGSPEDLAAFTESRNVPFACLLDTDRSAYRAYGLGRASLAQVFGPSMAGPFLRANLDRETRQRGLKGGSFMQMPGTFVVDIAGMVMLAHRNHTVADSPRNDDLLGVLEPAEGSPPPVL